MFDLFPFAHIGYTFLVVEIFFIFLYFIKIWSIKEIDSDLWGLRYVSFYSLLLGSLGPDIIDKGISLPITGNGRYIAHSLIFALGISLLILILFWRNRRIWIGFIIGWMMHLVLDTGGFMPWLFPFVSYEFPVRDRTFLEMFMDPSTYLNEIFGVLVLILILLLYWRRKLSIKQLLKTDLSKQPIFLQHSDENGKDI